MLLQEDGASIGDEGQGRPTSLTEVQMGQKVEGHIMTEAAPKASSRLRLETRGNTT
jgi:hypothetical protein